MATFRSSSRACFKKDGANSAGHKNPLPVRANLFTGYSSRHGCINADRPRQNTLEPNGMVRSFFYAKYIIDRFEDILINHTVSILGIDPGKNDLISSVSVVRAS
jgi:hypothetical protein